MAAHLTTNGPQGGVAFLCHPSGYQYNIPASTSTTIDFQTEIFDVGANFASSVFTAPVTGKYLLTYSLYLNYPDRAADYFEGRITTSNRTFPVIYDLGPLNSDPVYWNVTCTAVADMDASDTAKIVVYQGAGSGQMDLEGDAARFSGCLVA